MEKETIKFEDFATFRAMVSGAAVKYYDCAVDYIPLITERGNELQCRELFDVCEGKFRRIPLEYEAEVRDALEVDNVPVTAVYAFGSVITPNFICFAYDFAEGLKTELMLYQERVERLGRLHGLYNAFKSAVSADIARCRAEHENFVYTHDWESADLNFLEHIQKDLDMHFSECKTWLEHHVRVLQRKLEMQ